MSDQVKMETANSQIRQICAQIEKEALGPAQQRAIEIEEQAKLKAEALVIKARAEAEMIVQTARQQIEQERALFHTSLRQAANLSIQSLKNAFENELFHPEVIGMLERGLADPVVLTRLIRSLCDAIERDGLGCDLSIEVSKSIDVASLNALLGKEILKKLKTGSCLLSNISGGFRIKVFEQQMTIDLTDQFLSELLEQNLQSSFAKTFFQNS